MVTGDPTLDGLIAEFAGGHLPDCLVADAQPVSNLRQHKHAFGMCSPASAEFAALLSQHGVSARVVDVAEELYDDRPDRYFLGHCAVQAETPAGVFLVDWTAAQYGYAEFPFIHHLRGDGAWQRLADCSRPAAALG